MPGLTPKQERFCEEFLVDANATAAAKRAGYSAKTANAAGPRLLVNVGVRARIDLGRAARSEKVGASAELVLADLMAMRDEKGWVPRDRLRLLELIGRHVGVQAWPAVGVEVKVEKRDPRECLALLSDEELDQATSLAAVLRDRLQAAG